MAPNLNAKALALSRANFLNNADPARFQVMRLVTVSGPYGSTNARVALGVPWAGTLHPLEAEEIPQDLRISGRKIFRLSLPYNVDLRESDQVDDLIQNDANGNPVVYEVVGVLSPRTGNPISIISLVGTQVQ